MNEKRKTGNSYLRFVLIILVSAAAGGALGFGFFYFLRRSGGSVENVFHGLYTGIQACSLPILTVLTVLAVILGEVYLYKLKNILFHRLYRQFRERQIRLSFYLYCILHLRDLRRFLADALC